LTESPSPLPLPSREGRFTKFPLPLRERVRVRGIKRNSKIKEQNVKLQFKIKN